MVEDDFTTRKLLMHILGTIGSVDVATDGEEAMEALQSAWLEKQPYDLISLDVMMPRMDGSETLRWLRKTEASLGIVGRSGGKVVMTTAMTDSQMIMGSFKDGCEAYIKKPLNREQLLKTVRALLDETEST